MKFFLNKLLTFCFYLTGGGGGGGTPGQSPRHGGGGGRGRGRGGGRDQSIIGQTVRIAQGPFKGNWFCFIMVL